jgi:hypothetical protein
MLDSGLLLLEGVHGEDAAHDTHVHLETMSVSLSSYSKVCHLHQKEAHHHMPEMIISTHYYRTLNSLR